MVAAGCVCADGCVAVVEDAVEEEEVEDDWDAV
jgi:hypothetical protein